METPDRIRAITYLSPGIPLRVYEGLMGYISAEMRQDIELRSDPSASGPATISDNPFTRKEVEIGFMCTPPFLRMKNAGEPSIRLLGAAPVFATTKNEGRPVFYSAIVVSRSSKHACFEDLATARWAYNDKNSLSGYFNLYRQAVRKKLEIDLSNNLWASGSHQASIEAVISGRVDAAAIDSNVLHYHLATQPALGAEIRIMEYWGPFPSQPIVVRSGLAQAWVDRLTATLLHMSSREHGREILGRLGLEAFAPVDDACYRQEELDLNAISRWIG